MEKFYTSVSKYGNSLLCRGYENGQPFKEDVKYCPTLFINCKDETPYKDIYGNYCLPIYKESMTEMKDYIKQMKDVSNVSVLGMENYQLAYISDNYRKVKYDTSKIRKAYIDIEVYSRDGFPHPKTAAAVIDAITHYDTTEDKYFVFGLKSWEKTKSNLNCKTTIGLGKDSVEVDLNKEILDKVVYKQYPTERELLINYLRLWSEKYPDVVTGWNSDGFDLPYIVQRIENILGTSAMKKLSPWNLVHKKLNNDKFGQERLEVDIVGVSQLDYMPSYLKFGYRPPRAFYSLDYISLVELGQQKLEYTGSHADLSDDDYQKYIDYNIKDVFLVHELNRKLALIELIIGMAYDSCMNYQDVFSPVKMWDAIIFNQLREDKIVIPKGTHGAKGTFPGAFVKEPKPNLYKWIVSFDLTSLYPMLLNQYNISPETIRNKIEQRNISDYINKVASIPNSELATTPNGMQYTKEFKGVIPTVALQVFNDRIKHKALMKEAKQKHDKQEVILQNTLQMSKKIAINSLYGALGNAYFRYYDLNNAAAVTSSGQLSILWIERKLNEYFNKLCNTDNIDRCIAIDTDSTYFNLEDFVEKYLSNKSDEFICTALNKFCEEKVQPFINESYSELAEYMNAYEQRMEMDREAIARTGFWTAKKRYALDVLDMEGYRYTNEEYNNGENLKILGLETQKSSTAVFIQNKLKDCIVTILRKDNNELIKEISKFENEFMNLQYTDVCGVTAVNGLKKYSDKKGFPVKGAQIHVKGALAFNRLANELNEELIQDGDKIQILFLREPNKIMSPSIAIPSTGLPKSFPLKYISSKADLYKTFEKVFLDPLKLITDSINWKTEDTVDITSFFE